MISMSLAALQEGVTVQIFQLQSTLKVPVPPPATA